MEHQHSQKFIKNLQKILQLFQKIILQSMKKSWRLHSENKEKGDVDILGEDLNSLRAYGRVRWFGRVV